MKRSSTPLRYTLLTYRLDHLWLPAAFWALFLLLILFVPQPESKTNMAAAYLGGALPLLAGILAAYAILDDPALELQFSSPRPAWRTLFERLGMILVIVGLFAFSYQACMALIGIDLSPLGGIALRQLAWLVPCLALMALGSAGAFALAQPAAGAMLVALIWMVELLLRSWFASNEWGRYLFIYMGIYAPQNPYLIASHASLLALSLLLLAGSWALLKNQERYI
ncbi:MAG: hypothetical protein M1281_09775 [Chloroflexi bacterium]|nr:hypothetical protein [Chloroflexota bacterium]